MVDFWVIVVSLMAVNAALGVALIFLVDFQKDEGPWRRLGICFLMVTFGPILVGLRIFLDGISGNQDQATESNTPSSEE